MFYFDVSDDLEIQEFVNYLPLLLEKAAGI